MRVHIVAYLDGKTVGCGYKFTLTKSGSCGVGWRAYRTVSGLKRFLDLCGLKIDPQFTELRDYRDSGNGRLIYMRTYEKEVIDPLGGGFWFQHDVPPDAKPFVDMCNGSYVRCFVQDEGDKVTIYKPNPNAKSVYGLFGMDVNLDEIS